MGIKTPTIRLMTIPIIGKQWEFRPQHILIVGGTTLGYFPKSTHSFQLTNIDVKSEVKVDVKRVNMWTPQGTIGGN